MEIQFHRTEMSRFNRTTYSASREDITDGNNKETTEVMNEEIPPQQPQKKSRARRRRAYQICKFVAAIFFLLVCVLMCWLIVMVHKLNAKMDRSDEKSETAPGGIIAAAALSGDADKYLGMSNQRARKIAHLGMIGIRQDNLLQDCLEYSFKKSFPNVGYALMGYDIYNGFPLANSHDPGFTKPIFRADYSQKRQTADCRFSVPNGMFVISDVSCETSFLSKVIENKEQLESSFSTVASLSVGFKAFSFESSFGYKKMSSSLEEGKSVYVTSSAHCNYYFVKMLKETAPEFDDIFLIWLNKLQKSDSNTTYIEFMDTFGTHFIREATFGARYTNEHKMTSKYYESMKGTAYSASVRASFSGKISVGGGFSLDSEQRVKASEFTKNVETRTITVGAAPPANGDALTWASVVQENPVPIRYVLEPIENIFVDEYVGKLGIDYEMIQANILRYKDDYKKYREENSKPIAAQQLDNRIVTWPMRDTLYVTGGGYYGKWGESERCPPGQFAVGYNLKIEAYIDGDNTALNAVKLICADINGDITGTEITSTEAMWGYYRKENAICPRSQGTPYFLTRFALQMHDYYSIAATFVNFACRDLQHTKDEIPLKLFPGYGEPFGKMWFTSDSCPAGTAICGIRTMVEPPLDDLDDSALNDVKFYCCGMEVST